MSILQSLPFADRLGALAAVVLVVVAALLFGLAILIWRLFHGGRVRARNGARQHRLDLVDARDITGSRQLVLVRRDNVEHLVMIGGPNDVLIESHIVRAQPHGAQTQPPRAAEPAQQPSAEESVRPVVPPLSRPTTRPAIGQTVPPAPRAPMRPMTTPLAPPMPAAAPPAPAAPVRPAIPAPAAVRPSPFLRPSPPPVAPPPSVAPQAPRVAPEIRAVEPSMPADAPPPVAPAPQPDAKTQMDDSIEADMAELAKLLGRPK